jgi:hypothetical protein
MSIITSGLGSTHLISQGYGSLPITGEAVPAGWYPLKWIVDGWYTELWNLEYGLSAPTPTPSASNSSRLREIIRRLESYNQPETAHRLKEAIRNAEKNPPQYMNPWAVSIWEPGMWEENRLREIIRNLRKH